MYQFIGHPWKVFRKFGLCGFGILPGKTAFVTTICAKAFIIHALQKSLFNCPSGQCIFDRYSSLTWYTFRYVKIYTPHFLIPPVSSNQSYTV